MIIQLLIAVLIFVLSCRDGESQVLATKTFATIYVALVDERTNSRNRSREPFDCSSILEKFGVTRVQIEETVRFYNEDFRRWKEFYAEVTALQEESIRKVPATRR